MTSPSEKPQPETNHTAANIEELKGTLFLDKASESRPPSHVFNSQAPGSTVAITEVMRDIKLAAQKVPQIEIPEHPEKEPIQTDDGPEAA